ncbi:uncharacterized protein LOC129770121 [Toxorhynchites rutilus septentrionalis]|uniref:uncharacterized protein LOC129770121 n=1 Tax=Toxorhynchites rutilus septentrionalis TaxID=329112 RepID=UPI002479E741|nr:uncharacterized protein LOC129770121 [Toxorhynchites rutilus septentrionalis]
MFKVTRLVLLACFLSAVFGYPQPQLSETEVLEKEERVNSAPEVYNTPANVEVKNQRNVEPILLEEAQQLRKDDLVKSESAAFTYYYPYYYYYPKYRWNPYYYYYWWL